MTKFRKYTLRGIGIFFGVLLLLYIVVFAYVSLNKQKIIKQVTDQVSKKLNGKLSIGTVELSFFRHFPKVSVLLHKVLLTDTMIAQHHHPLFEASEVFIELSIMKLIKKESALKGIRIEKGNFYLFTDTSGYTNKYLLSPRKEATAAKDSSHTINILKYVVLKDVRVTIEDRQKEKLHDLMLSNLDVDLDDRINTSFFTADANILVHSLAFNLPKGSFLKEKTFKGNFDMRYDKQTGQLKFDSIDIKLSDQLFNMSGVFDLKGTAPQFSVRLHTRDILYPTIKKLLPDRISKSLSIVDIDKPLTADAAISGPLRGGDPLIDITWNAKHTQLKTPFLDFEDASFSGNFTDEVQPGLPRKDPNSRIVITNFSALWNGLPVRSGNIDILDLSTPTLTCDLQSDFPLASLNELIATNSLQLKSGDGSVNITYKGPIEKNNNTNSFINGFISFNKGTILYTPRDVLLEDVNGKMIFQNSDVFIENLQTVVLKNKIVMNGQAKNLLTLMNTEPNNVNIDWNIYSPSLNLGAFTYLLKSRKNVTKVNTKKKGVANMASKIDQVLEAGKLHVTLKTDRLLYKKFEAGNVIANVSLLQDRYIINDVSMSHAGGRMNLSGSLVTQKTNYLQAQVSASLQNVDVSKVFRAFDNFGQQGITDQSLEGQLTAKVSASLGLNENGKVYPNSVQSIVDFSLKNGALNNYEPIKKLQRFIFKKRDFENIRFAELKNRLEIKDQEIKINRMEIQSSVLSMFVEGIYSQKGTTDISIQVPLSNLKKRGADYNPENVGMAKKTGKSIFIRGRPDSDGSIKFKLDLFNKFDKDKDKK